MDLTTHPPVPELWWSLVVPGNGAPWMGWHARLSSLHPLCMEGWGKGETPLGFGEVGKEGNRHSALELTGLTRNWANFSGEQTLLCSARGQLTVEEVRQASRWQRRPLLFLSFPR